jgi:hypothetical protein
MTDLERDVFQLRTRLFEARDQALALLEERHELALTEPLRIATVGEFSYTTPTGTVLQICLVYFGALSEHTRLPLLYMEADWVLQVSTEQIAQLIYNWIHLPHIQAR